MHWDDLLQQVFHWVSESVRELVDELAASDVHAVHDGVFFTAQDAVSLATRFQNLHLSMLIHHHPDLLHQGVQMLNSQKDRNKYQKTTKHNVSVEIFMSQ